MSQPIPPTPGSGLSPSLLEFAVVAIVSLAVAWAFVLYFAPIGAAYAQLSGMLAFVRP